jgi:hypothetical protein
MSGYACSFERGAYTLYVSLRFRRGTAQITGPGGPQLPPVGECIPREHACHRLQTRRFAASVLMLRSAARRTCLPWSCRIIHVIVIGGITSVPSRRLRGSDSWAAVRPEEA